MRFLRRELVAAAVIATSVAEPARGLACLPPAGCEGTTVFPVGDAIPSTAPALESWPATYSGAPFPPADTIRLERFDGTAWQPALATVSGDQTLGHYTLVPSMPFEPDVRYRFTGAAIDCGSSPAQREFVTAASAPLPTRLGTLSATTPLLVQITGGMAVGGECSYPVLAMVSVVSITVDTAASPWEPLFFYEARVDGAPFVGLPEGGWPQRSAPAGGTFHGRGTARLSVACAPGGDGGTPFDPSGLAEGDHTVSFRARVVGTETWLETDTIRVSLHCPVPSDAGIGTDAAMDDGAVVPANDGAVDSSADAAVDAHSSDDGHDEGTTGGTPSGTCGCRVPESSTHAPRIASWVVAALAGVARRRRRP